MARKRSTADQPLVSSNVFVVEHYLSGADWGHAEALTRRLRATDWSLRHALFVPDDETYFAVYDRPSVGTVRAPAVVASQSGNPFDRIVRAVLIAVRGSDVGGER
jgi:hypothetical protein